MDDSTGGSDKVVFDNDWVYLEVYNNQEDSSRFAEFRGYRLLIGHKDRSGNISCWQMSYEYFLENRLLSKVPAIKYEYDVIIDDWIDSKYRYKMQQMIPVTTYVTMNEKLSDSEYDKITGQLAFDPAATFYCNRRFDRDFFKKAAMNTEPDIILTKNKTVISRGKSKLEKKFERLNEKNTKKAFLKKIKSDF